MPEDPTDFELESSGEPELPTLDLRAAARVLDAVARDAPTTMTGPDPGWPSVVGYSIESVLGEGRGGTVYRAYRDGSEHAVALKVLHHQLGASAVAQRAWRELDMLSHLRLPALPRVLDHGVAAGRMYIATELIDGQSPVAHCDERSLGIRERALLLARIADAVHSLHERGVIHRDLKPSNVIVDSHGAPMLLDLGIATLQDHDSTTTVTAEGTPIGTPAFMSPEQARGELSSISTRSDVYGLGALAYVVLTGQTPHECNTILHDTIRRVASEPARDPRALDPLLPRPLAAVLRKAVAQRAEERYPSASEFAAELRRWLSGQPVEASDLSIAQRIGQSVARHPLAVTTMLALLILATSVVTALVVNWRYNVEPAFLEVDTSDGSAVVLRARSGRTLHRWPAAQAHAAAHDVRIVRRPPALGGGQLAMLAVWIWNAELGHRLTAFDVGQPDRPLWTMPTHDSDFVMPSPISRQATLTRMGLGIVRYGDYFPEEPAPQILATFTAELFSATCLRVIRLDGEVLFEVWHDGHITDVLMCPESGLLHVLALNSEGSLSARGHPELQHLISPAVVFALRPQLGARHSEWIRFDGGRGTHEPVWYRAILPLEGLDAIGTSFVRGSFLWLSSNANCHDAAISFQVSPSDASRPSLMFTVDASTGEAIDVVGCDVYKMLIASDPERYVAPSAFHLGPVPAAAPIR